MKFRLYYFEIYPARILIIIAIAFIASAVGVVTQYLLAEAAISCLDSVAPNWYYYRMAFATDSTTRAAADQFEEFARKLAWGDFLFWCVGTGFFCYGVVSLTKMTFHYGSTMTLLRAYSILTITGLLGGVLGGILGSLLGYFVPNYYRGVFSHAAANPGFDPFQIGLGLGVSQGLPAGLAVGSIILCVLTWYQARKSDSENRTRAFPPS